MPPKQPIVLTTAFLPPIQYISKFISDSPVYIEGHENFQKQSYRNRCYIYGPNGKQCLIVPVKKTHGQKTSITLVEIDYQMPWQKTHLKSIQSAYQLSPFYEYYADEFIALFNDSKKLLFDWNQAFLHFILEKLGIQPEIRLTCEYEKIPLPDFRAVIQPKSRHSAIDEHFSPKVYPQVFSDRYGFIPNLSIIDLLFNEGPQAKSVLEHCIG